MEFPRIRPRGYFHGSWKNHFHAKVEEPLPDELADADVREMLLALAFHLLKLYHIKRSKINVTPAYRQLNKGVSKE